MIRIITYTEPIQIENENLPRSYREFVGNYGYGNYCGLINVVEPDEKVIYSTFADFNFWKFDTHFTVDDLREAIQLCSTSDGDIICCIKNRPNNLFILQRDSETILKFKNLEDVLSFYKTTYSLSDIYFEPMLGRKVELFSLVNDGELLDISFIHKKFLKDFEYDFVIGSEQPKYVIEKMGGWIKFDLVYKNSISINYQLTESSKNEHSKYCEYLKNQIKRLTIRNNFFK